MSTIEEKCKEKGVRLTEQRKTIAKILSESKKRNMAQKITQMLTSYINV